MKKSIVVSLAIALSVVAPQAASASRDHGKLFEYVVRKGDTCVAIAKRIYGTGRAYRHIHKHNRNLGPLPHKLRPGRVLLLPRPAAAKPDARVTAHRGPVQVRGASKGAWKSAKRNMGLFRAWRVNSKKRASAELTFRDRSKIHMRDDTLVIIYGRTRGRARVASTTAHLERGTLRARLAELDGAKVQITTAIGSAIVRGSNALVSVDEKGITRFANHRGKALRVKSRSRRYRRRRAVRVRRGMGTKVVKGKAPSKPKPLPATPKWQPGPQRFAGWHHLGGTVTASWSSVAAAKHYRVEISRDEKGVDTLTSVTVASSTSKVELHRLPAGTYYARVASIDADKFESAPSVSRKLEVVGLELSGLTSSPAVDADKKSSVKPAPVAVALGAVIRPPAGTQCRVGGTAASGTIVMSAAGVQQISCAGPGGTVASLPVRVEAVEVASPAPAPLQPGKVAKVNLSLSSKASLPEDVWVVPSDAAVEATLAKRSAGRFELTLRPRTGAPNRFSVSVFAGLRAQPAKLATLGFSIAQPPTPTITAPVVVARATPPRPTRFEVGLFGGAEAFLLDHDLGNPRRDNPLGDHGHVGVRLGVRSYRQLVIEAEGSLGTASVDQTDEAARLLSLRLQGRIAILQRGRLSPFVLGGFAVRTLTPDSNARVRNDTDVAGQLGVGAHWRLSKRGGLRIDVRQLLTPGRRDGLSTSLEGQLGVFSRF